MFDHFKENKNQISFDFTQISIDAELESEHSFKYELKRPERNTRIYITEEIYTKLNPNKNDPRKHDSDNLLTVLKATSKSITLFYDTGNDTSEEESAAEDDDVETINLNLPNAVFKLNVQPNFTYFTVPPRSLKKLIKTEFVFTASHTFHNRLDGLKHLLNSFQDSGVCNAFKTENEDLFFNGQSISRLFFMSPAILRNPPIQFSTAMIAKDDFLKKQEEHIETSTRLEIEMNCGNDIKATGTRSPKILINSINMINSKTKDRSMISPTNTSPKEPKTSPKAPKITIKRRFTRAQKLSSKTDSFATNSEVSFGDDTTKINDQTFEYYETQKNTKITGYQIPFHCAGIGQKLRVIKQSNESMFILKSVEFDGSAKGFGDLEAGIKRFFESKPTYHSVKLCEIGCAVLFKKRWRARLIDRTTIHLVDKGNTERINGDEQIIILPEQLASVKPFSLPLIEESKSGFIPENECFVRIVGKQKDHYCGYRYTIEAVVDEGKRELIKNDKTQTEMMKIPNSSPLGKTNIESKKVNSADFIILPMISQDNEEFLIEIENMLQDHAECNTLKPAFPLEKYERDLNQTYLLEVDPNEYESEINYARVKIIEKRNKICDIKLIDYEVIVQVHDTSLFELTENMNPEQFPVVTELISFHSHSFLEKTSSQSDMRPYYFLKQMIAEDAWFEVTKHNDHAEITDKRFEHLVRSSQS